MGDTGSMAFGGALAGFAIVTGTEALLILIGGIYVVEALSVIIQTVSFKYWGRRVFLIAPIHHHFEMKAWSETKIMVRFWIVAAILCACGFVLYYRYYLQFRLREAGARARARALRAGGEGGARGAGHGGRRRRPDARRTTPTSDCSTASTCSSRARACPARRRSSSRRASAGSRSGARSSSLRGCCRTRSSASPARTGRRRRPSCSARCSARARPGNVGTALSELVGDGRARTTGSSASSRASSSRTSTSFRPRIAVLLNLEPDHLDRHGTFERYRDAKLRIFENQTAEDVAVVPRGFGPVPGAAGASSSPPTTCCRPSR